ncbi:unnamed protein product [Ostreobium quekettii]|uniref:Uncharacterized protein n=1 Tax=Ostreobium quekettii TaxID=121088 RepID=A0A8S1J7K7_9CHLO|nr:unnamed protein product [Ostreobium quekettii]
MKGQVLGAELLRGNPSRGMLAGGWEGFFGCNNVVSLKLAPGVINVFKTGELCICAVGCALLTDRNVSIIGVCKCPLHEWLCQTHACLGTGIALTLQVQRSAGLV